VINADALQLHADLRVLSARPSAEDEAAVPHRLYGILGAFEAGSAGEWSRWAADAMREAIAARRLPIICGGTGQYINAVIYDWQIPAVKPYLRLRAKLEKKSSEELFALLKKLDPRRAKNIDRHNPRRLIRAIEIAKQLEGQPNIPLWAQQMPAFVHEKRGEFDAAAKIIQHILDSEESLPQGELNFMRYFIEERIKRLDSVKAEFDATQREQALRARGAQVKPLPPQGPPPDVGAPRAP
jgi:tRNA A37 N6-isopentenylltransferase MiaA